MKINGNKLRFNTQYYPALRTYYSMLFRELKPATNHDHVSYLPRFHGVAGDLLIPFQSFDRNSEACRTWGLE